MVIRKIRLVTLVDKMVKNHLTKKSEKMQLFVLCAHLGWVTTILNKRPISSGSTATMKSKSGPQVSNGSKKEWFEVIYG